jgi:hypothetical protein
MYKNNRAKKKKTQWTAKTKSGNKTLFKKVGNKILSMTAYKTKTGKKMALVSAKTIVPAAKAAKMLGLKRAK